MSPDTLLAIADACRRHEWRTFRVDRLTPRSPTGPRFAPREPPDGDVATYLAHQLSSRTWPLQATFTLHESAEAVADRVWPGMGAIEAVDDHSRLLHLGADTPRRWSGRSPRWTPPSP